MIHKMKLSEPWYTLVKNGTKTVEGRMYDEKRKLYKVNDIIIFTDTNGKGGFKRKIKRLLLFKDFDSAIRYAKLKRILPGINRYEKGVKLYRSIYKDEEIKKNGVILIYMGKYS